MVAGYPGSTNRYALYDEFQNTATWQYPVVGQHLKNLVALVERAGGADEDIEVKYAATVRSKFAPMVSSSRGTSVAPAAYEGSMVGP